MATEPTPTDAEIDAVLTAVVGDEGLHADWLREVGRPCARAILARWGAQPAQLAADASGRPHVVRLAEDFAEDCIRAGYVTTKADSHRRLMDAVRAQPAPAASPVPLTDPQLVACIKAAGFKTWDSRMWALKLEIESLHGITKGA